MCAEKLVGLHVKCPFFVPLEPKLEYVDYCTGITPIIGSMRIRSSILESLHAEGHVEKILGPILQFVITTKKITEVICIPIGDYEDIKVRLFNSIKVILPTNTNSKWTPIQQ
jgi:hypothetical protein